MTQNKPTDKQKAQMNGYQQGSVASRLSTKQRREMNEWLKRKREDAAAYERQLSGR